jgi:hypothetical protein
MTRGTTETGTMNIKSITIEGHDGTDIEIIRVGGIHQSALVTQGNRVICEVRHDEENESRRLKATEVAKAIYGTTKKGRWGPGGEPNCTGSMVYDVRCEIERLAGC